MKCSEEWELWVEMADGGSEVRRRMQRQWISELWIFTYFTLKGFLLIITISQKKHAHAWRTFYWIQSNPTRIAALVAYVTSSALSVGQVTGLHSSLGSFAAMHKPCKEAPADSTRSAISFSGVIEVTDKEQPNNSRSHHSTSVCTLYAWHRFQTVHELKLPTLGGPGGLFSTNGNILIWITVLSPYIDMTKLILTCFKIFLWNA